MKHRLVQVATTLALAAVASVTIGTAPALATDKARVDLFLLDGRTGKTQPCVRETGPGSYVQYWCRDIIPDRQVFQAADVLATAYARYGDTRDAPQRSRDVNGDNYTVYANGGLWEGCHHYTEFDDIWVCNSRAEDAKVYLFQTNAWDYYLGAMHTWATNQRRADLCVAAIYLGARFGPDGQEWNRCTGQ